MKNSKAAGPDIITGKLFKTCHLKLYIYSVFPDLFHICVELGEVSFQWKTSEIEPVPKNPLKNHNYHRHIALTSLLVKSFERIVLKYKT